MSKAALITTPKDLIKRVNSLIYGFIWKGNDKVKRSAIVNDIENRGREMLDLDSMVKAQRLAALKTYILMMANIPGRLFKTSFYEEWVGNLTSLVTFIFVNY